MRIDFGTPSPLVLAGALGMVGGVVSGAMMPALWRLVPRSQLAARAAPEQGLNQVATTGRRALAGILFGLARWVPFLADAVSYVVAAIANLLIRTTSTYVRTRTLTLGSASRGRRRTAANVDE